MITPTRLFLTTALLLSAGLSACDDGELGTAQLPLAAVCLDTDAELPPLAWVCGEDRVEECSLATGSHPELLFVTPAEAGFCAEQAVTLSDSGPFAVGNHTVVVTIADAPFCESHLTVVDTLPPSVTVREPLSLWPPNHKLHEVTPWDCVTASDACDPDVAVVFTWATSDEPHDANGDGNTTPDITLTSGSATLRAERQGGGDGRVYTLGWVAADDSGNHTAGTCEVHVRHDQGKEAHVDSGAAELHIVEGPSPVGGAMVEVSIEDGQATVLVTN